MDKFNSFLLCLALLSIKASATKTIVCGHFNYAYQPVISAQYYATPIDFIESIHTQVNTNVDSNGNFHLIFDIDKPTRINVMNGDKWVFINKFINPGDSLWFGLFNNKMDIEGTGEDGITAMFEYDNKFLAGDALNQRQNSFRTLEPLDFARYWTNLLDSELAFYDESFKNRQVPDAYKNAVRKQAVYDAGISLAQYSFRGKKGNRNVYSDTAYMQYLAAVPFNDKDALVCNDYTFFLGQLTQNLWQCKNDSLHFDSEVRAYNRKNCSRLRDSIARVYLKGDAYDVALYYILYEEVNSLNWLKGAPGFDAKFTHIDSIINSLGAGFNDKIHLDRLKIKLAAFKEEDKPAPDFTAWSAEGKEVKLSDFRGKVVYVDFWATSCGPCVAELPHIPQLQEKFRDKDVVFLYVSFDNKKETWQRFIDERNFRGVHLIDTKGFNSEAALKYNIAGIPRFILVDKKGLLVSAEAPRPSARPEELIEKELEKP